MFQRWICGFTAVWLGIGAIAAAQDRATVQMRDGSKFEGRIEELTANGELFVRVSQHDQRRVPVTSVALIDKVGGASGLPDTELREATGSQHLLLLTNGSSVKGQLVAIRGGEGSANENSRARTCSAPPMAASRRTDPEQVSRVYLGAYPFAAITGARQHQRPRRRVDDVPGALRMRGARRLGLDTGLRVRKGEWISFSTLRRSAVVGQRQRSRARGRDGAHGAGLAAADASNAGALIGRVGNSQPFGIGDQAAVPMPFDGILYLAVNDDERADNAGEFIVSIRSRAANGLLRL